MEDSRLIRTLKTFTKDEFKQLEKFVASPFFNNGRNYLPLLNELKKHYPGFENKDDSLKPENIYKKIYPGKIFDKQIMWNMVSQLEKLAMEFILQIALKDNKTERFALMLGELTKRNLDKEIFKEIEKIDNYIDSIKLGKEFFSLKLNSEISKSEYWYLIKGRMDKSAERTFKITEFLILNLLTYLSIHAWELHVLKQMYNTGEEINSSIELVKSLDIKKLVSITKKNESEYASVINFYFNQIMCIVDENKESYFFEMKQFFEENYNLFDTEEQRNTIMTLANYCSCKMRFGKEKFGKILFELNKFRLEKEIETNRNGKINKILYQQILNTALLLGEIQWAENFLKEYTSKLKKEHQKTMNVLAWGYIYFAKKEYTISLEYLNKVEFIDLQDKLHVRRLSAQAYYELNNTELLFYYIDSSKHFIGNNTAIESNSKEACMKFFNFLKKLLTCKENPEQNKLKELKEDLHFDRILRLEQKKWLLEKTDEL